VRVDLTSQRGLPQGIPVNSVFTQFALLFDSGSLLGSIFLRATSKMGSVNKHQMHLEHIIGAVFQKSKQERNSHLYLICSIQLIIE
jgi:hypothetical protein